MGFNLNNKDIHKGHRERLREFAKINGISKMQEHQALELLLTYVIPQKDVNPIAHNLINKFGSFSNVLDAKQEDLLEVKGIGNKTAYFLASFKDFFHLYKEKSNKHSKVIKNTAAAVEFIKPLLEDKLTEEIYVICLDGFNNIKKFERLAQGVSNAVNLLIRNVTEFVFKSNCHNVLVCHNHPNGSSAPSNADDKVTKSLVMALSINNINLLDHIILGKEDFYSYNISGKIAKYNEEISNLVNYKMLMQNICGYNNT